MSQNLTPNQIRTRVKQLLERTDSKYSYYSLHGFFSVLAISPNLTQPAQWLPALFPKMEFLGQAQAEELIEGLLALHNQVMQSAAEGKLQLPKACSVPQDDPEAAFAEGHPLGDWSRGAELALGKFRWIERADSGQTSAHELLLHVLGAFANLNTARKLRGELELEQWCKQMRREINPTLIQALATFRSSEQASADAPSELLDPAALTPAQLMGSHYQGIDFETFFAEYLYGGDEERALTACNDLLAALAGSWESDWRERRQGQLAADDEGRLYLEVLARRAQLCWNLKQPAAAIASSEEALMLWPEDHAGLRYQLANWLCQSQDWDALERLYRQYPEEGTAFSYARALAAFAREGDTDHSRTLKKVALDCNAHLPAYLSGDRKLPKELPEVYMPGDKSEAICYVAEGGKQAWRQIPGSMGWLKRK